MKAMLLLTARLVVPPTIVLALVATFAPGQAALAVRIWLLVLVSLGALTGLGALRRAVPTGPGPFSRSEPEHAVPAGFPSLARVEREITLAAASAHDVHFRLRPTLRTTAAALLSSRRGVQLDRQPERAREILGPETWELVRPDRPTPDDPRGPGLDRATLEHVVASLEAL
jgi:hypothetical protein